MELAGRMAKTACELREEVRLARPDTWWGELRETLRCGLTLTTQRQVDNEDLSDTLVQSVVCGMVALQFAREPFDGDMLRHVTPYCGPLVKSLLNACDMAWSGGQSCPPSVSRIVKVVSEVSCASRSESTPSGGAMLHFYEQFLKSFDAPSRQRHGVFYTPPSVARYIASRADRMLRDEFGLVDGLADVATNGDVHRNHPDIPAPPKKYLADPFVRIFDPAAGTGIFLIEVIDQIHRTLVNKWQGDGQDDIAIRRHWNQYVSRDLLPRVVGFELMLPAALLATIQIARKLAETGYEFASKARIRVYVTDTLAGPESRPMCGDVSGMWRREVRDVWQTGYHQPATVILGNPPFSGISQNDSPWMEGLLKGQPGDGSGAVGYYHVDGQPLGERKVWLQDDYVKFLRYAHWHIERAGCGLIGFVTNHGYLDNVSFRGMRQRLIDFFSRITIVDLHGNRKKRETTPEGGVDESVFPIEQGVAIGLFRRTPGAERGEVWHRDVWGTREQKTRLLNQGSDLDDGQRISPQSPHYLLRPQGIGGCDVYDQALSLPDAMPVNSTAAVTARDGFVVAFNETELLERMCLFRDLSIPSREIRQRFFTNSRSKKYLPGDTRGWKLDEARRVMAVDTQWNQHLRSCLYRPFDRRVIYWADGMIDWPRLDVMQYMTRAKNLALVTRRQMVPRQPCNFFWVSDSIVIDGVIRSDNRGSESLFPLYLPDAAGENAAQMPDTVSVNFAAEFLELVQHATGLRWDPSAPIGSDQYFGPLELFAYIYGLFHAPTYRHRYADWLGVEFPRVVLPSTSKLFRHLSRLGRRLIDLHNGLAVDENSTLPLSEEGESPYGDGHESVVVGPAYPKYEEGRVLIDEDSSFDGVSRAVWEFQVGSHQVCRKWLRDRRGRELAPEELSCFRQVLAAVRETQCCMRLIDQQIERYGGWPEAFAVTGTR